MSNTQLSAPQAAKRATRTSVDTPITCFMVGSGHLALVRWVLSSRLTRNAGFNLAGTVLPAATALLALPSIISGLGPAHFGMLSLLWALIGYSGVLDFGIGRALTKVAAERRAINDHAGLCRVFWATTWFMLGISMLVLALAAAGVILVHCGSIIPRSDALTYFCVGGVLTPAVLASVAYRGFLEAHEEFATISVVRSVIGTGTFLLTLGAIRIGPALPMAVAALAAVRAAGTLSFFVLCYRLVPSVRRSKRFYSSELKALLHLGGWMTVSNVISPVMVYLDRFLIGLTLSLSAVGFYTAPFDFVTKLLLVPTAIAGVLFPRFSALSATDVFGGRRLYNASVLALCGTMLIPVALLVVFAKPGLALWLGRLYAERCSVVLQLLTIGVWFNAVGSVPYALIQGLGRPDVTAKLHLIETPLYLLICFACTARFGIEGTAGAWCLRVTVDALLLLYFAHRLIRHMEEVSVRGIADL